MNFLKAHWPTIMAVGGTVITFLLPSLQAAVAHNPKSIVGVLAGCLIAAYYSQSPLARSGK